MITRFSVKNGDIIYGFPIEDDQAAEKIFLEQEFKSLEATVGDRLIFIRNLG